MASTIHQDLVDDRDTVLAKLGEQPSDDLEAASARLAAEAFDFPNGTRYHN